MSVLSRAAAPPATHEVAAAVAALLTNLDTTAPQTLLTATEAIAALDDDPRLGASDAAEAHAPRRLLGPSGLGAPSLRVNLPTPQVITELAGQASRPPSPAGGAVPTPRPPISPLAQPLRPIPRTLGSGHLPSPPSETRAAGQSSPSPTARRVASGPTGIGTSSAFHRGGVPRGFPPVAPTSPAARADTVVRADAAAPAVATSAAARPDTPSAAPERALDRAWDLESITELARGIPGSTAVEPGTTMAGGASEAASSAGAERVSHGPSGIGTGSTRRARGAAIPALYCPPPVRDNPALAEAVNFGIIAWAEEIGLYEGRLDDLRKADFGRLIMLAHPDCDDADRLLAAAKCAVSEWSVDDYYCEEDASDIAPDGSRSSPEAELGPRLELAAAAMDPVHLPPRYQVKVEEAMQSDPILRAFRTSFEHLSRFATPTQVARLRTEIAGWFIALGAEAGWRAAGRMPPVWEYLLNRQPHSFLPCMAPIDAVGGYEVPAAEYTDPRVRRVVTTAALASQMVNDLYSMAREDLSGGREFNLPTVLAAEEQCSRRQAVQRTAEVHDELVHRFEAEAGALAAAGSPELRRFLTGLWAWMGGNRAWHADSRRYNETP
ncbi:family 2 encapsulin nanocompartment cargo protein terpene cyclase [Nocardia sp. NPDC046763]|uniref:family 2 encapsulin nanocompartment cargo protein terpene cyclase n=1 Tax=Nocardia sp. NPDC046763 TaxID=3155256 RepID=UPI0033C43CB7